ncbi:MAG: MATE family efflux transporter [Bacteroidia bacterium]|nr:MAG: MATE family efflux transporter [Bacteroidia bacterium]
MFSYKKIIQLVLPLVISGFGQSVIYVTDVLFLGRLGEVALGASAIAGLFYASIMMVGFGISSGLQVIIAQKTGEGRKEETNQYLLNGVLIQFGVSIFFTVIYFLFNDWMLEIFVESNEVRKATKYFLSVRILGLLPYFLFYAYRAYYLGIGEAKIISFVTIIMSILNLILNPVLIYGWYSILPPLNYIGSAWASVIAEVISTLLIMFFHSLRKKSTRFISHIQYRIIEEILKVSTPLIFQHFISVFSWFLFFLFIEKMGTTALAISNVVRAVYVLVMAPILAFSHSTVTIIGQIYGSKEYSLLKTTLFRIILLSIVFTLPFSIVAFLSPSLLMRIFTDDVIILQGGETVMQVISFALLYFAASMPILSAVTGLGDTNKALFVESISFVVYIFSSAVLVFVLRLSLPLVWCNEFIYFSCIAFISYYFLNKKITLLNLKNKEVKLN